MTRINADKVRDRIEGIREIRPLSLNLLYSRLHFQRPVFEQKTTKGTKRRETPRPLFPSLPSVKWFAV